MNRNQDSCTRYLLLVQAQVSLFPSASVITGRQCNQTADNSVTCDHTLFSIAPRKKRDSGKEVSCSSHELRVNPKMLIRITQNLATVKMWVASLESVRDTVSHTNFVRLIQQQQQNNNNNNKILLIRNRSNYISFSPQIAYKLIEAGRSRDILQIQGLSIDGLNNRENTTIQYIE